MIQILDTIHAKTLKQSVGWLETELPKSTIGRLESYIETAKKNPTSLSDTLAGNISKSLIMDDKNDWFFETTIIPHIIKFKEYYPSYMKEICILTEDAPFCLDELWVNFQKQHEFNPTHNHSGVFSFVVFMKIPTDWREQHALPFSTNSNAPVASDFAFSYTSILGNQTTYNYRLDKRSEGKMLFFPAVLNHFVYPFYNCDKERISLSGNIRFDISENSMKQYRNE